MEVSSNLSTELIAFLDANIILEGKPLADLPWHDVASEGVIRLLIVPQAMEEIDAKKRDGRLGPHARAFNRLIAPAVIKGHPIVLRDERPRVELQMATCSRVPWDEYDELDPGDGDSRIVAEALNVRNIHSDNRILISHDIKPLVYARGRGLRVLQASDDWLRAPEPSPKDKEIQRLKQQVAEFKKDEPIFDVSIEVCDSTPFEVLRIEALAPAQAEGLTETIKRLNPKKPNGIDDVYGLRIGFNERDSSYDGKYKSYVSRIIPAFASKFHEKLELLFNQRLLKVVVTNVGPIRADHLVVVVETSDGMLNDRVIAVSQNGPPPPVPRPDYFRSFEPHRGMRDLLPARVGRHEFETTREARRTAMAEQSCEDFRSGQCHTFEGVLTPSSSGEELIVRVKLTAKNFRGEHINELKLKKRIKSVHAEAVIDMNTLELKRDYSTEEEIDRLLDAQAYDQIEWDGSEL